MRKALGRSSGLGAAASAKDGMAEMVDRTWWDAGWWLCAEVDGVVRTGTDGAVRGIIARALATEGQISAVAAAMFCRDAAPVSMLTESCGAGLAGEGGRADGRTHGQQGRLKGHYALRERRLRSEDGSVDQYRMLVREARGSI